MTTTPNNVISLSTKRNRRWILGTSTTVDGVETWKPLQWELPIGRITVMANGQVEFVPIKSITELSATQIWEMERALNQAAYHGNQRQNVLDGRRDWVGGADLDGRIQVAHDGSKAWFRRTVLRASRFQRTCDQCRAPLKAGDAVLRVDEVKRWPRWRDVLLHPECVKRRPHLGEVIEGRFSR